MCLESIGKMILMEPDISTPQLYDLSFLEQMGDNGYLLSMLNLLVTETPKDLVLMRAAALAGDNNTVSGKAHVLKSTAGIIRINKFVDLMLAIELGAKQNLGTNELLSLINMAIRLFEDVETGLRERMLALQ